MIGLVVGATGRARARDAIGDLTSLTESALDLHGRALAEALGMAADGVTSTRPGPPRGFDFWNVKLS